MIKSRNNSKRLKNNKISIKKTRRIRKNLKVKRGYKKQLNQRGGVMIYLI